MIDLRSYLDDRRTAVNLALGEALHGLAVADKRLHDAMRHSLMAGGKRLRPILCLAAADAVDGDDPALMPAACALECIHTYSLIHDDLPALDNDLLRRGKPTCHAAFDEATALLAGDALLTCGFELLAKAAAHGAADQRGRILDALVILAQSAGAAGMVAGQIKDMNAEHRRLQLEQLQQVHRMKTGAMIEASVRIGATIADGSQSQIDQLSQFARHIGLAFQVVDDILNVKGDPAALGKAVGTDADRAKNTYPALMGLQESENFARSLISESLSAIASFDHRANPLRALARYVVDRER